MLTEVADLAVEPALGLAPREEFWNGDQAVARAVLDAGVRFAASYPGTPATDILEELEAQAGAAEVRCIWAINEKVAYESAFAVAIAGQRAVAVMKHVGLNVAADAFVSSCYAGPNAGLVLVVADDPGCHSSQNEQDSRHYQALSGTLLLEPADSQEAYAMTREAFRLSERFRLPVLVRLTTRTALGCARVQTEARERIPPQLRWPKDPDRFLLVPQVSRLLHRRLAGLQEALSEAVAGSRFGLRRDSTRSRGERAGILCTGVGASLARELAPEDAGLLKVAGLPYPDRLIRSFVRAHDEIFVLEEGDPILEERVRAVAGSRALVHGRLSGALARTGELVYAEAAALLQGVTEARASAPPFELPARIPEICKPCGYHKVFGALAEMEEVLSPSDIGCNTLGGLAPYRVMDSNLAMGASIGMACGLAALGLRRIVAILGDSTFFHAGLPPLVDAVHQGYTLTVLLLDNGTAAMTGGQDAAHRAAQPFQNRVDLVKLIQSLGVTRCTSFDPHRLGKQGIRELLEASFLEPGVKVLLYRSQCGLFSPGYFTEAPFSLAKL